MRTVFCQGMFASLVATCIFENVPVQENMEKSLHQTYPIPDNGFSLILINEITELILV